jgi:SAM-dependent methyltransferase
LSWLTRKVRPHLGDTVLEVGAGIGNIAGRLMARRMLYVAAEKDPLHLHALRNRFLRTPNVLVQRLDPETPDEVAALGACFDTVLCLNVLEYLDDPASLVRSFQEVLKENGTLVVLVPNSPRLFGSLDRAMGHKRRFDAAGMRGMLASQGFTVQKVYSLNKAGSPPWWAYGRIFGRRHINKAVLKIFDKTVWLWRRVDALMPWPGLSLIVVATRDRSVGRPSVATHRDASVNVQ